MKRKFKSLICGSIALLTLSQSIMTVSAESKNPNRKMEDGCLASIMSIRYSRAMHQSQ